MNANNGQLSKNTKAAMIHEILPQSVGGWSLHWHEAILNPLRQNT